MPTATAQKPLASTTFKVETWTLEQVKATLAEYNPRLITERTLDTLGANIDEFGFLLPVVINSRTNRTVGGHQRVKAAERKGINEIPVHLVDLDESEERALNLALNKIEGKWDYALLEEALAEVSEADILTFSGFNETDLIEIMSGQDDKFEESFEEFTERFAGKKTRDVVSFRSGRVAFTCPKTVYEALVHRLYSQVGVDDTAAGIAFFRAIGLGE